MMSIAKFEVSLGDEWRKVAGDSTVPDLTVILHTNLGRDDDERLLAEASAFISVMNDLKNSGQLNFTYWGAMRREPQNSKLNLPIIAYTFAQEADREKMIEAITLYFDSPEKSKVGYGFSYKSIAPH